MIADAQSAIERVLSVDGAAREMHPVVRDEVYRIGYEAIRNACMHSRGQPHGCRARATVMISSLRVATTASASSRAAERGKDGHFGLRGMRERAARIGATLSVTSAPGAGTAVAVTVPGRAIFSKAPTSLAKRIRSILSGTQETE